MKTKKLLFSLAIACLVIIGCKNEAKKDITKIDKQNVSLAISGMTCEIGCAKTIQSKLSKKEGVLDAKVIFKDSIANIEFDANTVSKKDLIAFVDGIAGGELYKATENSKGCKGKNKLKCANKKECSEECMKKCLAEGKECASKKECKTDSLKKCCDANKKCDSFKTGKKVCDKKSKTCKPDCKKACCSAKKE